MRLGCITGRRFALLFTVVNRSRSRVELTGLQGDQVHRAVIRRVAVQLRAAPAPPSGDRFVAGLRRWNRRSNGSLGLAPGGRAWIQSNFVMGKCELIAQVRPLTITTAAKLDYSVNGSDGVQPIRVPSTRMILRRLPSSWVAPVSRHA
jgi:hypothetical protein